MEEYWNPNDPAEQDLLSDEQPAPEAPETAEELTEAEPMEQPEEYYEEPPKPKKKKTFKKRVRRFVRRFMRLPLVTQIIAIAAVVAILAAIILLIVFVPRNCAACKPAPAAEVATPAPSATAETEPTDTPTPTDEPIVTATPFIIPALTGNLKLGDTNVAVVPYVRQKLVELGYMPDIADIEHPEVYDQALVNGVKRFQYRNFANDVRAWDGIIGQTTYDLLTSSSAKAFFMRKGDDDSKLFDNDLVTELQKDLIQLGYLKTSATGTYDDATYEAVKSFQRASGLNADGIAGLRTLQILATLINAPEATAEATTAEGVIAPASQNP